MLLIFSALNVFSRVCGKSVLECYHHSILESPMPGIFRFRKPPLSFISLHLFRQPILQKNNETRSLTEMLNIARLFIAAIEF